MQEMPDSLLYAGHASEDESGDEMGGSQDDALSSYRGYKASDKGKVLEFIQ